MRVSVDFTEGRLANKNDSRNPWTGRNMLQEFIDLNNQLFARFSPEERMNIGVHTCPGGDCDSVHSKEVPYGMLLEHMFDMNAGYFLIQCASEEDRESVYEMCGKYRRDDADGVSQMCFMGVINPLSPEVETAEHVRDELLMAAKHIPIEHAGRHRRLRLLAVQPRRQAEARLAGLRARRGHAEDLGAARGRPDGLGGHGHVTRRGHRGRPGGVTGPRVSWRRGRARLGR